MTEPLTVTSTEFKRGFAHYQREVREANVVVVTNHDQVVGAFLSPRELARYERLKAREREAIRVADLPGDLIADIAAAEYGKAPE